VTLSPIYTTAPSPHGNALHRSRKQRLPKPRCGDYTWRATIPKSDCSLIRSDRIEIDRDWFESCMPSETRLGEVAPSSVPALFGCRAVIYFQAREFVVDWVLSTKEG